MLKIKRLSSMIAGAYCALEINDRVVNRKAKKGEQGLYIVDKGIRFYESELPLGEEVYL